MTSFLPSFSQVRLLHQDRSGKPQCFRSVSDAWSLVFVRQGDAALCVSGGMHAAGPGSILLFPPRLTYAIAPAAGGRLTVLYFACTPPHSDLHDGLLFSCVSHPVVDGMLRFLQAPDLLDTARDRFLEALLLQLDSLPHTRLPSLLPSTLAGSIQAYLDEHFREELSLHDLSEVFHVTTTHIIHVFKPLFGLSPIQYLIQRRVGQAQYLLLSTTYSAGEIAGLVGIPNRNYFYSTFKRLVGMTPSQYRACALQGPDAG